MDLSGHRPPAPKYDEKGGKIPDAGHDPTTRVRLEKGGIDQGHGQKFDCIGGPVENDWPYHAVANVMKAHTLLRSFPGVDPERTAVTGISWGGYTTCLAASLDEGGMTYLHLRPLGTPKAGRDANRAGRMDDFRGIYMARFSEPDAQLALLEAEDLCRTSATALLCFCGDEKKCHRHIIATALEAKGLKRKEIAFR
jgi:hypothetical protein